MSSVIANRKCIIRCGFLTKMTFESLFKDEQYGLDERKSMKIVFDQSNRSKDIKVGIGEILG